MRRLASQIMSLESGFHIKHFLKSIQIGRREGCRYSMKTTNSEIGCNTRSKRQKCFESDSDREVDIVVNK